MRNRGRADTWSKRAKASGYPARSVYKLEEIQRRYRVIPRGGAVLDLGCCPGSWSRFVREVGGGSNRLVGVDIQMVGDFPGTFVQGDIEDVDVETLRSALGGPADLVLSDMAPATGGDRFTNHIRQLALASRAVDLAEQLLGEGGALVVKVFDGEDAPALVDRIRGVFGRVKRVRPKATRNASVEFFLVATGFGPSSPI